MSLEKIDLVVKEALNTLERNQGIATSQSEPLALLCPLCQDQGMIRVPDELSRGPAYTHCECHYLKLMERATSGAGVFIRDALAGKRISACVYRAFPPSRDTSAAVQPLDYVGGQGFDIRDQRALLAELAKNPLGGYCLIGPTGTGKTFLLYALAKEAAYKGCRVIIRKAARFIEGQRLAILSQPSEDAIILPDDLESNRYGPCHLFLDELENIPTTEFATRQLFEILDWCYDHADTIVLSVAMNVDLKKWQTTYGAAAGRRIEMLCAQEIMMSGR